MISILIKSAKRFNLKEEKIRFWAREFLKKNGLDNCELSFSFVNSEKIRTLNRNYRGLDKATTVLTFFQGQATPEKVLLEKQGSVKDRFLLLGDIVICPDEAKKKNLSVKFLIEHGIKNLLSEIPTAESFRA